MLLPFGTNLEAELEKLIGEQKRRRHLYRKLISLGVSHKSAANIYKYHGRWRLSYTRAVERGYSNAWFESQGFKTKSCLALPHWKPIDRII